MGRAVTRTGNRRGLTVLALVLIILALIVVAALAVRALRA